MQNESNPLPNIALQIIQKTLLQQNQSLEDYPLHIKNIFYRIAQRVTALLRQQQVKAYQQLGELRQLNAYLQSKMVQCKQQGEGLYQQIRELWGRCELAERQYEQITKQFNQYIEHTELQQNRYANMMGQKNKQLMDYTASLKQDIAFLQEQRQRAHSQLQQQVKIGTDRDKQLQFIKEGYQNLSNKYQEQLTTVNKTLHHNRNADTHLQHQRSLPTPTNYPPHNDSFMQSSTSSRKAVNTLQQEVFDFKFTPHYVLEDQNSLDRQSEASEIVMLEIAKEEEKPYKRSLTGSHQRRKGSLNPPLSKKQQKTLTDKLNSIFKERVDYKREAMRKHDARIDQFKRTITRKDKQLARKDKQLSQKAIQLDILKQKSIKSPQKSPQSHQLSLRGKGQKEKSMRALSKKEERMMYELNLRKDMHWDEVKEWREKYERLRKDSRKLSESYYLKSAQAAALEQQLSEVEASFNQEKSFLEEKIEMMSAKNSISDQWSMSPSGATTSLRYTIPHSPRRHSHGEQDFFRDASPFYRQVERLPTLEEEDPTANRSPNTTRQLTENVIEESPSKNSPENSMYQIPNLGEILSRQTRLKEGCTEREILSEMREESTPKHDISYIHEVLNDYRARQLGVVGLGCLEAYQPRERRLGMQEMGGVMIIPGGMQEEVQGNVVVERQGVRVGGVRGADAQTNTQARWVDGWAMTVLLQLEQTGIQTQLAEYAQYGSNTTMRGYDETGIQAVVDTMNQSKQIQTEHPTAKDQSNMTQQSTVMSRGTNTQPVLPMLSLTLFNPINITINPNIPPPRSHHLLIHHHPSLTIKPSLHHTEESYSGESMRLAGSHYQEDYQEEGFELELIEENFVNFGAQYRKSDSSSYLLPSHIPQELFISINNSHCPPDDSFTHPPHEQQHPTQPSKESQSLPTFITTLEPFTLPSSPLKVTSPCPPTTQTNSRALTSGTLLHSSPSQIGDDVLSSEELQCMIESMYEVRRVVKVASWNGHWSEMRCFNLSKNLYVIDVANSRQKMVLWQGRVLHLTYPNQQLSPCPVARLMKMSPLLQIQLRTRFPRLILGNCQLILIPPRLTLSRLNKHSYFIGDLQDGEWQLSRITVYEVL